MKRIRIIIGLFSIIAFCTNVYAQNETKSLREMFKNNEAIIYTINIRNFSAIDKDNDGIIDIESGDINGTFVNAKERLKTLKDEGINTIYVMPITKTGKLKALGTAGSLYAMDSFSEISPFLDDTTNDLTVYDEAKDFVDYAHSLGFKLIVDLPSCGSFDLSIKKPSWFLKNRNNETYAPADWVDVRLFKVYNRNRTLNEDTLNNFKSFVDLAQNLGFDGIRADVAAIKPYAFWKNIISYARIKNPDFLFLAEANPEWSNPALGVVNHYATPDELLSAGFDCYYGSWSDFKNIKTKKEFDLKIEKNLKILKNNKNASIMTAVATHDQQAPILRGVNYWNMVLWLNATLKQNAYFLDGFSTGDNFTYSYENKKAKKTYTDDEYYFVHSGMFDIFNLSAQPIGKYPKLKKQYLKAIDFKKRNADLIKDGKFTLLKTNNDKVFGYKIKNIDRELIVVGSLDENKIQNATVKSDYLKKDYLFSIINSKNHPKTEKNKINVSLEPLEIQVYLISLAKYRAM